MTIFGIRIMREKTFRAYEAHSVRLLEVAEKEIETPKVSVNRWKDEYRQTAELRRQLLTYEIAYARQTKLLELTVADLRKSHAPRTITVKPIPGFTSGLQIEVER